MRKKRQNVAKHTGSQLNTIRVNKIHPYIQGVTSYYAEF